MKMPPGKIGILLLFLTLASANIYSWELSEHRQLGDSVFTTVMSLIDPADSGSSQAGDLGQFLTRGRTFGQICARFASDDLARDRFHRRGLTVLEQLQYLSSENLDSAWRVVSKWLADDTSGTGTDSLPNLRAENVVCAYLIYHLMALRIVKHAFDDNLENTHLPYNAIILEAAAQGYLADAFSAGHILTPVSDWAAAFHPRNNVETHNQFRNFGVYVIDSRGHAWQTFGDRLLQWYAPTYERAFEAGCASLKELYAAYLYASRAALPEKLQQWFATEAHNNDVGAVVIACLASHSGGYYYTSRLMPTLSLIPMPVAASWSYRTATTDEHGIARRFHFPQLREPGLHDPDLENIDENFLYSRNAMPDWLVPPPFHDSIPVSPGYLIKYDADWASVRWVQDRVAHPSYKGLLVQFGGQSMAADKNYEQSLSFGLGYGFWDDLLVVKSVSAALSLNPAAYESDHLLLTPALGFTLPAAPIEQMSGVRVDGGVVFGLKKAHDQVGGLLAFGLDSKPLLLGFTNAGVTFRFKYQWIILDRTFHGPAVELIMH